MKLLLSLPLIFILASCGGGADTISWKPDYWGHREGPKGFTTVILDAGHGGRDSGAISSSTKAKEKDLALDTAERIKKHLGGKVNVILLRKDDRFIDLDDRVKRVSGKSGTILISIHYNSGPARLRGPETYWWRVDSWGLATRLHGGLKKSISGASGNRGQVRRRLRLTRNPDIPSVLLECGYLSNPTEAALCNKAEYRDKLAKSIARAIIDQKENGDPAGKLPKPINKPPSRPTDPPGS